MADTGTRQDRVQILHVLEELQGERALAADDARVVEGVHDRGAAKQLGLGRGGGRARGGRRLALDELRVVAVMGVLCVVCICV